jgi:ABC-type uncharacterized transport system ATPase component
VHDDRLVVLQDRLPAEELARGAQSGGAGKTTLINIICGIVNPTSGSVAVDGRDIIRDYRAARSNPSRDILRNAPR